MGNSEQPIREIQAIIKQMARAIPSGRFFEFGVDVDILEQIESYLSKISVLMDDVNASYASRSLVDIKHFSDAATAFRALEEFVKEVRDKEGGSKKFTSQIRTLINDFNNLVALLAEAKPLDKLETENLIHKKAEIQSPLTGGLENNVSHLDDTLYNNRSVFISYAWGDEREEIVNQIDQSLQKRKLKITRDKRDLGYKGSIKEFMERIGQGNCVIIVVSDKYLRSSNCMFELVEIADNKQFYDRVFPIVLSDASIYDPVKRIEYVKYWELKRAELAEAIKTVDPANLQGIRDDMDLYDRIRDKVSGLTSILKDMNTLTPDMHRDSDFSDIYNAIEKRMRKDSA